MKQDKYSLYSNILLALLVILHIPGVKKILSVSPFILPIIWSALIGSVSCVLPCVRVPGRISLRQDISGYAFSGAIIFLSASFLIGVFLGKLNATPYDISPEGIFHNLLSIVPALTAREMVRSYAVGNAFRQKRAAMQKAVILTLLFALLEINFGKIPALTDAAGVFSYVARDVVPVVLKSMILSLLVYYGGFRAGLIYALGIAVFQRTFPFLPSLPWLADSALGILFPVMFAFFLNEKYQALTGTAGKRDEGNTAVYGACLILSVLFAWFVVGVFPVYPSVVLTGSMEPGIRPGDAILVKKLTQEEEVLQLEEGDIINFKREEITITHRILEVRKDEAGNVSFVTKGDNNQSPDAVIVNPNDINGTVSAVIPKIGLPVMLLKSSEPIPEGVTEE